MTGPSRWEDVCRLVGPWSDYGEMLETLERHYGTVARLLVQLKYYDEQVCQGGHHQYIANGFHHPHIPMVDLFDCHGLADSETGQRVLAVMKSFRAENISTRELQKLDREYLALRNLFIQGVENYTKQWLS
jgi:hypothetical protein